MRKVKITELPKKKGGGTAMFGEQTPPKDNTVSPGPDSFQGGNDPEIRVNRTLGPTDRENATLEAEKGETIITNLQGEGIPEFYTIGGKPHSRGGTPLNVPPNSFIFSVDKKLAIKDKEILKMFNKPLKGSFTPAELSKTFNLNKYRKMLLDNSADKIQIETAELMIRNFMIKLGALALAQESLKGFPDGIPSVALSYMEHVGIKPEDLIAQEESPEITEEAPPPVTQGSEEHESPIARWGGTQAVPKKRNVRITGLPKYNLAGQNNVVDQEPKHGASSMPKLKKGDQAIQDPATGELLIIDKNGNIKGRIKTPSQEKEKTNVEVETSSKSTKRQNIPEGSEYHDPSAEGYNPKAVKPGHYIKENGRWYKVTKAKEKPYDGTPVDELDKRLTGDHGDMRQAYGRLEQAILGNTDLQDKLYSNYQTAVGKKKAKGILKSSDIQAAANMTKEEVIQNYLDAQKQIMIINAQKGNIGAADKSDSWDKGWDSKTRVPKEYQKAAKELGLDPFDPAHTFAFQAAYIGMQDLKDDPDFTDYLKDYSIGDKTQLGLADEGAGKKGRKTISAADGWWGNTTTGEAQLYMPEVNEWEKEEVEDEKDKKPADDIATKEAQYKEGQDPAKWWTQDIVNIAGDAYDLASLKKYDPWQATPQFEEATPQFTDFRGTAARIGSAASAGAQQLATFAGPQAAAANFANIQKGTSDAILRAQEAEDRTNVAVANRFELANTQAKNQFNQFKAGLDTQLWDKNVVANQQFDNAKRALREKLRADFNQGWRNKGMTQTMNEMRDDYAVDPTTGYIHKKPGFNKIDPTTANTTTVSDAAAKLMRLNPGMDWAQATKLAKADAGIPDPTDATLTQAGIDAQNFAYPGQYGSQ
tara:strand:+ start:1477 stop:4092 length:2616 start_codon:yes stop_codon:yes gene_type:complete